MIKYRPQFDNLLFQHLLNLGRTVAGVHRFEIALLTSKLRHILLLFCCFFIPQDVYENLIYIRFMPSLVKTFFTGRISFFVAFGLNAAF